MAINKKIFPFNNNFFLLQTDEEGIYSISHPNDAKKISNEIISLKNTKDLKILDAMSGIGGNLISFGKNFKDVTGIEINEKRYNILKNNISCFDLKNVKLLHGSCLDYLSEDFDVYFFDPPWGGPDYKLQKNIEIKINDLCLKEVLKLIPLNKLVIFKLPFNCNFDLTYFKLIENNNIKYYFINT